MRKFVFILFLLYSSSLLAQDSTSQKGWAVTLTAGLIPISQPGLGIQPGVEYRFNERYSLLAEITIPVNGKNSKDSSELNKQYLRVKSELRYRFVSSRRNSYLYTGLQASVASRKFINRNSFYFDKPKVDSVYYYDQASINSPVTTVALQFGSIFISGRFAVDVFLGLGARFINTKIYDIVFPVRGVIIDGADGPHFTASYSYLGNVTMFQLNGGIRLMWHFYDFRHPHKG
jgi:hypothetical protein